MKSNKNTLNIFVSIAPSHNKNFEDIISANLVKGVNVLVNAGQYDYQSEYWDKVINGNKHIGNTSGNLITKIRFQIRKLNSYRKIIKKVKKTLPRDKFDLYYCNLEDVLNNAFFFSYRKSLICSRILVEDGILNYYDYKISKELKNTFFIKRILCFFLGIPYKIVKGQLSGIDLEIVQKQYVKYPSKAIYPEKAVEIPQSRITYVPDFNKVLFIGQDILENILGNEKYLYNVKEIFEIMKSKVDEKSLIIYKPHRNGDYKSIIALLEKNFENRYQLILDDTPVEKIIEKIKPGFIFSFYSTALLNIKMSLPEASKVQVFSKPLNSVDPKVLNLFKEVGIKLLT